MISEFAQTKWWMIAYLQAILATGLFAACRYAPTTQNRAAVTDVFPVVSETPFGTPIGKPAHSTLPATPKDRYFMRPD